MNTKEAVASSSTTSTNRVSKAPSQASRVARWNNKMLNRLTAALEQDPTIDMFTFLSPTYSKKLQSLKKTCKIPIIREDASMC